MEHHLETRTFERPDDRLDFRSHGKIDIIKMQDGTARSLNIAIKLWP